jgi:hypothetical protein
MDGEWTLEGESRTDGPARKYRASPAGCRCTYTTTYTPYNLPFWKGMVAQNKAVASPHRTQARHASPSFAALEPVSLCPRQARRAPCRRCIMAGHQGTSASVHPQDPRWETLTLLARPIRVPGWRGAVRSGEIGDANLELDPVDGRIGGRFSCPAAPSSRAAAAVPQWMTRCSYDGIITPVSAGYRRDGRTLRYGIPATSNPPSPVVVATCPSQTVHATNHPSELPRSLQIPQRERCQTHRHGGPPRDALLRERDRERG